MNNKILTQTTNEDVELAQSLWEDESCPYFSLFMFGDGRVFRIPSRMGQSDYLSPQNWLRITEIPEVHNPNEMNEGFAIISRKDIPDMDLEILAGECCSSGENGFVAVTSLSSGKLIWLAFFIDSNPFEKIILDSGDIVALSTSNQKYRFPISEPEQFKFN